MTDEQKKTGPIKRAVFDAQGDPFRALAYPMARMTLERLLMGSATAYQIGQDLSLSQGIVQAVLKVLVTGNLVATEVSASGATTYKFASEGLQPVRTWLARFST